MNLTVLGPQRNVAAARAAVADLMPAGPIATVNAGWQERESDSAELADVLAGRMVNLELHRRWQQVLTDDPGYAVEERVFRALLAELQAVYAIRLHHAMAAVVAVSRRGERAEVLAAAKADAIAAVQALDQWHLSSVGRARTEFAARVGLQDREVISGHREEVAAVVEASAGIVVAGGHVGVLLHLLELFDLGRLIRSTPERPLVSWSAGAMALSERVVLFHDGLSPPESTGLDLRPAEVYAAGLGVYSGVVPFPHWRRRLQLEDKAHIAQLAQRFAPRTCLLLSDGVRLDLREHEPLPSGALWLSAEDGIVAEGARG